MWSKCATDCGAMLARRAMMRSPTRWRVCPIPVLPHAIGYANRIRHPLLPGPLSNIRPPGPVPSCRTMQSQRNLIATNEADPRRRADPGTSSLLLIDDSIVRGTQLRETTEFLYQSGAREVHMCVRPARRCCTAANI